ncbi:MAG: DUF3450 family protein [Planctomycetes bacterium]|nr:DUF3450 family protein [Planctomycetota bacterium]
MRGSVWALAAIWSSLCAAADPPAPAASSPPEFKLERFEALLAELRALRTARARESEAWDRERLSLEALRTQLDGEARSLETRLADLVAENGKADAHNALLSDENTDLRDRIAVLRDQVLEDARRFLALPRGPLSEDRRRRFDDATRAIASATDIVEALDELAALHDEEIVFCRVPQASRETIELEDGVRQVVVLRLGPGLAFFATPDASRCGRATGGAWEPLPVEHAERILDAARALDRESVPELVELPIPIGSAPREDGGERVPVDPSRGAKPSPPAHADSRRADEPAPPPAPAPARPPLPPSGSAPRGADPEGGSGAGDAPLSALLAKVEAARADLEAERRRMSDARATLSAEIRTLEEKSSAFEERIAREERRAEDLRAARENAEIERSDLRDTLARAADVLAERARSAGGTLPASIAGGAARSIEERAVALAARMRDADAAINADPSDLAHLEWEIAGLFEAYLQHASRIAIQPSEAFLPDGTRATGQELRIGEIARVFLGDGGAPAGIGLSLDSGRRDIATTLPAPVKERIAAVFREGEGDRLVPLDLSDGRAIEHLRLRRGFWGTLRAGGIVMIPLLLVGIAGVLFAIERLIALARAGRGAGEIAAAVPDLVERGEVERATEFCRARGGPVARVLAAGIDARGADRDALESILSEAILAELPRLERRLTALEVFTAAAPLLGLLGTVTGMIRIFQVLAAQGAGNPRLLSGGISEALITTEVGLAIAIPLLLIHAYLSRRARATADHMEQGAKALVHAIEDARRKGGTP